MPGDMSKAGRIAVEHVQYNIPNQEPINGKCLYFASAINNFELFHSI